MGELFLGRKDKRFVRAVNLPNSALYRKGISFVKADKLPNSALSLAIDQDHSA
jgi:hypothetical protein